MAAGVEAVAALARREAVDIIHTNTIVTLEGALAAARLGIAHVWHSRGRFETGFPPAYFDHVEWIYGTVGRLSDAVVCTSEAVRVQAAVGCPASRLEVIHDGFDPDAFHARPVAPRQAVESMCNLPPDARYVACVGGIQRRKGHTDLVEALALLGGDFSDLHLVVCGPASDSAYVEALLARVRARGLESRVHLAGQVDDVRSVLAWCEMLVHPSHSEGFGLAVLEAMAASGPSWQRVRVALTRSSSTAYSGLLVPVGEPAAMADEMRRVLAEPGLGMTLGEAAGTRARRFAGTLTAERITSTYLRLVRPSWLRPVRRLLRRRAARRTVRELQARLDLLRSTLNDQAIRGPSG